MWWYKIITLNAVLGAVDLLFAVEGAYFVPAIYDKGLSPVYGSMILCLGPMLGIVFQSYLGTASDQCKCHWGKRRPFILALAITGICGLILFPFTKDIADLFKGDLEDARYAVLLVLTALATTISNFSAACLFVPAKAYLLDVLPEDYIKLGNAVGSVWISIGGATGFGIGVITWSSNFDIQVKVVCGISLTITAVCTAMTLFSVNEQNPQLGIPIKTEPHQASAVVNEGHVKTIQQPTVNRKQVDAVTTCKLVVDENASYQNPHDECHKHTVAYNNDNNQTECGCRCFNGFISSISGNLHFIRHMSLSMIILCFAMFFGFLSITTQLFFFTDFVADVVYDGDVTADEDSPEYDDYTEGVRVGSLALGVSAITSLIFSFITMPLMKLFGMRSMLVFSYVVTMLQSGVMIYCHNLVILFVLLPALYFMITMFLLIPYILVSEYAAKSLLLREFYPCTDTNLIGRACSTLMISMLFGDVVALMINGPFKDLYGGGESVMIISCISCFVGAVISCFVTVPSEDSKENTEVIDKHKTVAETTESTKLLIN